MAPRVYHHVGQMIRELADDLHPVVELGCGGKQYSDYLESRIIGLDLRADYYDGPGPDLIADAHDHPIRSSSVGFVFVVAALLNMPRPDDVIAECHRILRPGGKLVVFDYNRWVAKRALGAKQFSSFSLARLLGRHGLRPRIHWTCVPAVGPPLLRPLLATQIGRRLTYTVSNWIVVSGEKEGAHSG
jgi:SAM-dependent methyltransferase